MKFRKAVTYDDMLLVPQYSDIQSRQEVELSTELSEQLKFDLPIIASPMDTVSGVEMALAMHAAGGLAILHRYNTIKEQLYMVNAIHHESSGKALFGCAIGVSGDYLERATAMANAGVKVLCIDVAHGHHIMMKRALTSLRKALGSDIHIMAGNVCTLEGINDLADWGADSVRCNIGGGSICSTRIVTGHGLPGLQTIFDCAQTDRDVKIIADGGIKTSGDIVKALAAGADFVMCGSLLAGTTQSPGQTLTLPDGSRVKEYRGMASKDAQLNWRNKSSAPEGVASYIPYKGSIMTILDNLAGGVKSGFSYTGARNLSELRTKVTWARQTSAGTTESNTHILNTLDARSK
jgi:IMP dehydrogenase|tara:strand:+ start:1374 stop:2420 length:1047 start_codon:yes stop_codon:yes gene_type:complete